MTTIIPDHQPSGAVMELNARIVAAGAVAGDFHAEAADFQGGGQRPDYATWALRLEQHLNYVLDALNDPSGGGGEDGGGDLDGLEPYCAGCGAWVGIFLGHGDGWHLSAARARWPARSSCTTLATRPRSPGARRPAGASPLPALPSSARPSPTLRRTAVSGPRGGAPTARATPAGACETHVDDLDQADAYAELGRQLRQEEDQ